MSASAQDSGSAPSYDVPQERIVSIEHPCIVKNFSNGFKSLGGEQQLKHVSMSKNATATITLIRLRCSSIKQEAWILQRRIT
jgi:hypothetical protein